MPANRVPECSFWLSLKPSEGRRKSANRRIQATIFIHIINALGALLQCNIGYVRVFASVAAV